MMKYRALKLISGIAILCFCQSSMAALLDFTDSSFSSVGPGNYSGTIDGIGYTLSSSDGNVNFTEDYDGEAHVGCISSGILACNRDGVGISNDEITMGQTLTLTFDRIVSIAGLYFLDLYVDTGREQATITLDGTFLDTVDAIDEPKQGGYASLILTTPQLVQTIAFTAASGAQFRDDENNDYALAGVDVSETTTVPLPPITWLFGAGIAGLAGIRRQSKK